jgi:hypothetical protein
MAFLEKSAVSGDARTASVDNRAGEARDGDTNSLGETETLAGGGVYQNDEMCVDTEHREY